MLWKLILPDGIEIKIYYIGCIYGVLIFNHKQGALRQEFCKNGLKYFKHKYRL